MSILDQIWSKAIGSSSKMSMNLKAFLLSEAPELIDDAGFHPNIKDSNGTPVIMLAAMSNYPALVHELLNNGADPNAYNTKGVPVISAAVDSNATEIVEILLKNGANIHAMDKRGQTPLFYVHDMRMLRKLLEYGIAEKVVDIEGNKPHLTMNNGRSLLNTAIDEHNYNDISLLFQVGVDLNKMDLTEKTPIISAMVCQDQKCVQALLKEGADVNARFSLTKETVLLWAINSNKLSFAHMLLKNGANPNDGLIGQKGACLFCAFRKGDYQLVKDLLDHGADPDVIGNTGTPLLLHAVSSGAVLLCQILLEQKCKYREAPYVLYALKLGFNRIFDMLVNAGIDVNVSENGVTPLECAVRQMAKRGESFNNSINYSADVRSSCLNNSPDHNPILESLISHGANLNIRCSDGTTMLMLAVQCGCMFLFERCMEAGVSIDAVENGGRTALMLAAMGNNSNLTQAWTTFARRLIEAGADVNHVDSASHSALYYAVKSGAEKICRMLLEAGAEFSSAQAKGLLTLCAERNRRGIAKILVQYGAVAGNSVARWLEGGAYVESYRSVAEAHQALCWAIKTSNWKALEEHLDEGGDLDFTNLDSCNPLLAEALKFINPKAIQKLIDLGANVNIKTNNGSPLLLLAVNTGNVEIIRSFVKAGADLNVIDQARNPVLMRVIQSRNIPVLKMFLEAGADVHIKTPVGKDMVQIAEATGNAEIISLVKQYDGTHQD